jgi:hypothetical protein
MLLPANGEVVEPEVGDIAVHANDLKPHSLDFEPKYDTRRKSLIADGAKSPAPLGPGYVLESHVRRTVGSGWRQE